MNSPASLARAQRVGLVLFSLYLVVYGIFVALSAFSPKIMAAHAIGGVNVAVVYGFALIVLPLVLALVYLQLCRPPAPGEDAT